VRAARRGSAGGAARECGRRGAGCAGCVQDRSSVMGVRTTKT